MVEDNYGYDEKLTTRLEDNPWFDGTDYAHPAWWRGTDHGVKQTVKIVNEILDGKRKGEGRYGSRELSELHDRLLALLEIRYMYIDLCR